MGKSKYAAKARIAVVQDYLAGKRTVQQISKQLGVHRQTIRDWIQMYQRQNERAFIENAGNKSYTAETKQRSVEAYMAGNGSLRSICVEYNIRSTDTLRKWIKQYNSDIKPKDCNPKRKIYMAAAGRKTTIEERIEMVEYCLSHDKDYKSTAEKYAVSYNQVYSWVRKYLSKGEDGLKDNRGRKKIDEELSELEKLQRENLRLKRQLEDEKRAVELLKKVQEFERRRYWEKENKNPNI